MKKKIMAISLVLASVLSGCGGKETADSDNDYIIPSDAPAVSEPEPEPEEITPTDRPREIEAISEFEYEVMGGHAVITKYTGKGGDVVIPDTIENVPVTEIGFYAFEAKYGVTSVTLPETIELIGEGAFMDCGDMKSINLPESLKGIERGAFVACTSLESLVIPMGTSYICEEAFTACESMTSLTIKNPYIKYEKWGLEGLTELTVHFPNGDVTGAEYAERNK